MGACPQPLGKTAAIISLFLYKIIVFRQNLIKREHSHVLNCNIVKKFLEVFSCSKLIIFYERNGDFWNFFKTKSDRNVHQNTSNCTIFLNILERPFPWNPLAWQSEAIC